MLTANEREWLTQQRKALVDAHAKAAVYGDVVQTLGDVPVAWWLPVRAYRLRRERVRLVRKWAMWSAMASSRATMLEVWLSIHHTTSGASRGPVPPA